MRLLWYGDNGRNTDKTAEERHDAPLYLLSLHEEVQNAEMSRTMYPARGTRPPIIGSYDPLRHAERVGGEIVRYVGYRRNESYPLPLRGCFAGDAGRPRERTP